MVDTTREIEPLPLSDEMREFIKTTVNTKVALKTLHEMFPHEHIYTVDAARQNNELDMLLLHTTDLTEEDVERVLSKYPNKEDEYLGISPYVYGLKHLYNPTMDITDCVEDL